MFSQISCIADLTGKFWAKRCGLYAGVYGTYLERKQIKVFAICTDIASKQTEFFQKWDLFMNDDCYEHNVLSLCYNYSVLKVVGTHNFDAQKTSTKWQKFNILCGNDESHPLTK